jgi:hypothetical protein
MPVVIRQLSSHGIGQRAGGQLCDPPAHRIERGEQANLIEREAGVQFDPSDAEPERRRLSAFLGDPAPIDLLERDLRYDVDRSTSAGWGVA